METALTPKPSLRLRLTVLTIWFVPIGLASLSWEERPLALLVPLLFTGTYRTARIVEDRFEVQLRVLFVPLKPKTCKLQHVGHIATEFKEEGAGWGTLVLFGPLQWVSCWVLDRVLPAFGGPLQLWLVTAKGRELLAWRGFSDEHYEHNLELLKSRTGVGVQRR
ncbi:MAG: hypothetical protein HZA46_02595 [Planctomycetales bacterium]|nr:hypothetical protein [Planctomycetales bacterium]